MRKMCLISAFALLLAACGGGAGYAGTYETSYQGQSATATFQEDGGRLTGSILFQGVECPVDGSLEDGRARGKVSDPSSGIEIPFEATLRDDGTIAWTYKIENPFTGMTEEVSLTWTRKGAGAGAETDSESGGAASGIDPALVGNWETEIVHNSVSGSSSVTRVSCTLNADGTFAYGGGQSVIDLAPYPGGPGTVGSSDRSGVTTGRWKAEGNILYSKDAGATEWVPLGRYAFSGTSDFMIYTADGGKHHWYRR